MDLNPLEQLNWITMVAMASIFLVTYGILRKVFFTPILTVMEKRAGKLEKARSRYEETSSVTEQAQEEARRIAAEASQAAEQMHEEIKRELARARESRRAKARAEAESILAMGREEVARLKDEEQAKLKDRLLTCSRQTLVKMIPEVSEETLRFVVNRVLAAREAEKKP
jgi:F0F1-type ATP synthase membrane subunit b/b'